MFTRLGLSEQVVDPADIDAMEPPDLTVLMDADILSTARTAPSQLTITSRVNLLQVPREFELWSIGIFANVAGGPELLYGVAYCDIGPEVIRPGSPSSVIEHLFKVATVIGNAPNVTAIFSPDFEMVNIGPPSAGAGPFHSQVGNVFNLRRVAGDNRMITVS